MPLFEYFCKDCSHEFEVLVRSRDEGILCPQCKSEKVSKLFSTFAHRGKTSSLDGVLSGGASPKVAGSSSGCSSCSGGSCATCH